MRLLNAPDLELCANIYEGKKKVCDTFWSLKVGAGRSPSIIGCRMYKYRSNSHHFTRIKEGQDIAHPFLLLLL